MKYLVQRPHTSGLLCGDLPGGSWHTPDRQRQWQERSNKPSGLPHAEAPEKLKQQQHWPEPPACKQREISASQAGRVVSFAFARAQKHQLVRLPVTCYKGHEVRVFVTVRWNSPPSTESWACTALEIRLACLGHT